MSRDQSGGLALLGGIVIIAFILIVVLPDVLELATYLSDPFTADRQEGLEILTGLVINWWVPIAVASPLLFVLIVVVLSVIGAGDIL